MSKIEKECEFCGDKLYIKITIVDSVKMRMCKGCFINLISLRPHNLFSNKIDIDIKDLKFVKGVNRKWKKPKKNYQKY